MLVAVETYLAERPAMCGGLLAAASADGQLREVLAVNDAHIARPIRELIVRGVDDGAFDVPDATDAANAILGHASSRSSDGTNRPSGRPQPTSPMRSPISSYAAS